MADNSEQKDFSPEEMLGTFDEILITHIERLLGTNQGIEGLPMNLTTVSCLVLLATRETEIENFPQVPPERYTKNKLSEELAEMSIDTGEDFDACLKEMIDRGYLTITDDRYFAKKPTISMAQLFDKVFPQMPGLNMIAYMGQMIDEVTANRKDMDMATTQFYQMLEMHGVPIDQEKATAPKQEKKFKHLKEATDDHEKVHQKSRVIEIKPSDIYSKLKAGNISATPKQDPTITIPKAEITDEAPHTSGEEKNLHHEPVSEPPPAENSSEGIEMEDAAPTSTEDKTLESPQIQEEAQETNDTTHDPVEDKNETPQEKEKNLTLEDDDIEKKIAAFEEALGLKCPLCKTGSINSQKTAKGKPYYNCSNGECNFISWGKPFYLECPQCENPFLIEFTTSTGDNILKCARATCHYWQKFPWDMDKAEQVEPEKTKKPVLVRRKPRKKKVRRVVRKKK